MSIIETLPGSADFHLFSACIQSCYPESLWTFKQAEPIPEQHLQQCFVLIQNEKPIARAIIYQNDALHYNLQKTLCVGAYECIQDLEVARRLHNHIEQYCRSLGATYLIGPMNGSTWENYRLNQDNSIHPFFTEQIQQDYYNAFFEDWGMKEIASYFSSYTYKMDHIVDDYAEMDEFFRSQGARIRTINLDQYIDELEHIYPFLLNAFQKNFLYTPLSKESFISKYKEYRHFLKEDYVLIAEDAERAIIGIFFCIEDKLNPAEQALIIKTIARNPEKKWRGLGHWIGQELYKAARRNGIRKIIHAFMKTDGTSTGISDHFLGTPFKKYTLYGKTI